MPAVEIGANRDTEIEVCWSGRSEESCHLLSDPRRFNGDGIVKDKSIEPVFAVPSLRRINSTLLDSSGKSNCVLEVSLRKLLPLI